MNMMKKLLVFVLLAAVLVLLPACGQEVVIPEVPTLDPGEFSALEARIAAAEADVDQFAYLINASAGGETVLPLAGETTLSIDAAVPEGMKLAQWTVNGQSLNTLSPHIELTLSRNSVVKAEFRPIKKVTCINCTAQFLNFYEDNGGESFTELVFEDEYRNSYTGQTEPGGSLLLCVQSPIPAGKRLDHWLVNGVAMNVKGTVNIFNAYITEATTFEPVFVDKEA